MKRPIGQEKYLSLFPESLERLRKTRAAVADHRGGRQALDEAARVLSDRKPSGLGADDCALLLALIDSPHFGDAESLVLAASRSLREASFGNRVATMVPIEYGSFCSSGCRFCGWRADNKEMLRLRLAPEGIDAEIDFLGKLGFSHFEISGGDDLEFIRDDLPRTVRAVKDRVARLSAGNRVSICLTPLLEKHYADLRERSGLDTVLTWQETYDQEVFDRMVAFGPKKTGIDESFGALPSDQGFLQRLQSQEWAVRAGLQVGIGAMIGLGAEWRASILSVVLHGRLLIERYAGDIQPLIIGMPLWNPITTSKSDSLDARSRRSWERCFEYLSAVYLLSLPDRHAWVFPNCRVAKKTQVAAIASAGCFTSTTVRVGPGAYAAEALSEETIRRRFQRSNRDLARLDKKQLLAGEQFVHYFDEHAGYLEAFRDAGLEPCRETEFLAEFRSPGRSGR